MLTAARLRELLDYDPGTGVFRWRVYRSPNAQAGEIASCVSKAPHDRGGGYRRIAIDGKTHTAHRLAWLYVTGEEAPPQIDHESTNRDDNRFSNLRVATHSDNAGNRGAQANNTSGFKGVTWHKGAGRWLAQIQRHGRHEYLGLFDTPEAAHAAYAKAARETFGEFARAA